MEAIKKANEIYCKHLDRLTAQMDQEQGGKLPTGKAMAGACNEVEKQIMYAETAEQKKYWKEVRYQLENF